MIIKNCGYDILECEITASITHGEATKIGTQADYNLIKNVATKAGLIRGTMKLDNVDMKGTLILNPSAGSEDLIEFFTVSMAGGETAYVIVGQIYVSSGDLYILANVVSLS